MPPIMIRHAAFPHMSVYMCGCLCNGVRASLLLLQPLQSTESRLAVYASYWKHCAAAVQQRHVVVASLGCCIQAQCCRAVQAEHILGGVHLLAFSDAAKQDTCTSSTRALCRSIRHAHGSAWHPYRMQHELGWLHATHGPQAGRQASHHEMLPTPQWQHLSRLASSRLQTPHTCSAALHGTAIVRHIPVSDPPGRQAPVSQLMLHAVWMQSKASACGLLCAAGCSQQVHAHAQCADNDKRSQTPSLQAEPLACACMPTADMSLAGPKPCLGEAALQHSLFKLS